MFKGIFLILLFAHIAGDFYFQNGKLAEQKSSSISSVIRHCLIYALACVLITIPIFSATTIILGLLLAMAHAIIDFTKFALVSRIIKRKKYSEDSERKIYIIDQLAHIISFAVIAYVFVANNNVIVVQPWINSIFDVVGISGSQIFLWVLVILMIWKPANVTIKKLLYLHRPSEKNNDDEEASEDRIRTGGFIGFLERLIILILLSLSQYSAIGLVLTAKSIARYDKISKEKEFAEYYLLGTLLSTIAVIIISIILI
jgi:predicted outer membrane lipoprotein